MKQNQTGKLLYITSETKPDKTHTKMPACLQNISRMGTIQPGIFLGRVLWVGNVAPRAGTIASRERFKPVRLRENLVVA